MYFACIHNRNILRYINCSVRTPHQHRTTTPFCFLSVFSLSVDFFCVSAREPAHLLRAFVYYSLFLHNIFIYLFVKKDKPNVAAAAAWGVCTDLKADLEP